MNMYLQQENPNLPHQIDTDSSPKFKRLSINAANKHLHHYKLNQCIEFPVPELCKPAMLRPHFEKE